jgi:gas vesicle protein
MSERGGSGIVPFLFGVAVGAVLGVFFAPDAGAATRGKVAKGARRVRENAGELVDDLRDLVTSGEEPDVEDEPQLSARETLQQRLLEARRRRRDGSERAPVGTFQEDEPAA